MSLTLLLPEFIEFDVVAGSLNITRRDARRTNDVIDQMLTRRLVGRQIVTMAGKRGSDSEGTLHKSNNQIHI